MISPVACAVLCYPMLSTLRECRLPYWYPRHPSSDHCLAGCGQLPPQGFCVSGTPQLLFRVSVPVSCGLCCSHLCSMSCDQTWGVFF